MKYFIYTIIFITNIFKFQIIFRVSDEIACEKQCTFFEDFPCRSFAFYTR